MPSVNEEQVDELICAVDNLRDQCIIRLFFDSGMRLSELTRGIPDWVKKQRHIVKVSASAANYFTVEILDVLNQIRKVISSASSDDTES